MRGGKGGEGGIKGKGKKERKKEEGLGRDGNYLANEPSFSPDRAVSNSDFI